VDKTYVTILGQQHVYGYRQSIMSAIFVLWFAYCCSCQPPNLSHNSLQIVISCYTIVKLSYTFFFGLYLIFCLICLPFASEHRLSFILQFNKWKQFQVVLFFAKSMFAIKISVVEYSLVKFLSNFISSPSDRKRRKNKIRQLYNIIHRLFTYICMLPCLSNTTKDKNTTYFVRNSRTITSFISDIIQRMWSGFGYLKSSLDETCDTTEPPVKCLRLWLP